MQRKKRRRTVKLTEHNEEEAADKGGAGEIEKGGDKALVLRLEEVVVHRITKHVDRCRPTRVESAPPPTVILQRERTFFSKFF